MPGASSVSPGSELGRYTLGQRLETRPGGERWSAHDTILDRDVSLLVMPAGDVSTEAAVDAARRAAGIEAPQLVRILDVGQEGDLAFVAEDRLGDARTLTELVGEHGLPAEEVRRIVGEVATGVEAARTRGLHHLALGPGSVLLTEDGRVKVRGMATAAALDGVETEGEEASREDATAIVALAYAGLTGTWPLTGQDSGLPPAERSGSGLRPPSAVAVGVPGDLDTICRETLAEGSGPDSPGDLAAQIAPWSRIPLSGDAVATTGDQVASTPLGDQGDAEATAALPTSTPDEDEPTRVVDTDATRPIAAGAAAWIGRRANRLKERRAGVTPRTEPGTDEAARTDEASSTDDGAAASTGSTSGTGPARGAGSTTGAAAGAAAAGAGAAGAGAAAATAGSGRARPGERDEDTTVLEPLDRDDQDRGADQAGADDEGRSEHRGAKVAAAGAGAVGAAASGAGAVGSRLGHAARSAGERSRDAVADRRARRAALREDEETTESLQASPSRAELDPPLPLLPGGSGDPPSRAQSNTVFTLMVALVVAALVVGLVGVSRIGENTDLEAILGSDQTAVATTTEEGGGGSDAEAYGVINAAGFDPQGDQQEHEAEAPRVYDGDDGTTWTTEGYEAENFGGTKEGVGVTIDLGQPVSISEVTITLPEANEATVYAGDAPTNEGTVIGQSNGQTGAVDLRVAEPVEAQYVTVWFTSTVPSDDGYHRAYLSEIAVR